MRNLQAEMARYGVSAKDIGATIGKTEKTVKEKLTCLSQFGINDALDIRGTFFPGMTLEYLFARDTPEAR